jgi:phospholipid/cholesterol/gamma-HCH transport system permease protein
MPATDDDLQVPAVQVRRPAGERPIIALAGTWTILGFRVRPEVLDELPAAARSAGSEARWDLGGVTRLDRPGAVELWRVWQGQRPHELQVPASLEPLLEGTALVRYRPPPRVRRRPLDEWLTARLTAPLVHATQALGLLGEIVIELGRGFRRPWTLPWRDTSATIYESGGRALGITAMVGFLIGVVVSYLAALQLRAYGAEAYLIDVLGIGILRELGPLLAAILVAGRSGSSMTAELGVMRITQELDAVVALGISPTQRLVVPKMLALVISMPLLVVWTDVIALVGGMLAAKTTLGIGYGLFLTTLPDVTPIANLWLGLGKAVCFGGIIALTASHFGLRVKPSTESLAVETTNAVVAAITQVIVVDAIFAVVFEGIGTQ